MSPQKDKISTVSSQKGDSTLEKDPAQCPDATAKIGHQGEVMISIRVTTSSSAVDHKPFPIFQIPKTATIKELHNRVSICQNIPGRLDEAFDIHECNCKLGNEFAARPLEPNQFWLIHGKSIIERIQLPSGTKTALVEALLDRFGTGLRDKKSIKIIDTNSDTIEGLDNRSANDDCWQSIAAVVICSNQRHPDFRHRTNVDESELATTKVLDLYTSELPINPTCFGSTLEEAGLQELAVDGVLDIFTVHRTTAGPVSPLGNSYSVIRYGEHWEPPIPQSDRGVAIFLSCLWVFTRLLQKSQDSGCQDAVLHVFYQLTNFPPALRCLHILIHGNEPTAADTAAFSHSVYTILDKIMPRSIVGTDHTRVFEGARLLFGLILHTARTYKSPTGEATKDCDAGALPYLSAFRVANLRDYKTEEAVMHAVQTPDGLMEATLFEALEEGLLSTEARVQTSMIKQELDSSTIRHALLSGGSIRDLTIFDNTKSVNNNHFKDIDNLCDVFRLFMYREMDTLPQLSGRHTLEVLKPSQLNPGIAPCLTYDRNAHLAVYLGEQPFEHFGKGPHIFCPKYGPVNIDPAEVEESIFNALERYEADGTAVFDIYGSKTTRRRVQTPDEIVMFCVDCSQSMNKATDFGMMDEGIIEAQDTQKQVEALIQRELYENTPFDVVKDYLMEYEGYDDMVAIIAHTGLVRQHVVAEQVVTIFKQMLSSEIVNESKATADIPHSEHGHREIEISPHEISSKLEIMKRVWAGLITHGDLVVDFLRFKGRFPPQGIEQPWEWSSGDSIPTAVCPKKISSLPLSVTHIPEHLICPVSRILNEENLDSTSGEISPAVRDSISSWIAGIDLLRLCQTEKPEEVISIVLQKDAESFQRWVLGSMSLEDLYKIAFRALKGKYIAFQLVTDRHGALEPTPNETVSSCGIRQFDHLAIRITSPVESGPGVSFDMCLVKVYGNDHQHEFSYWVNRDTPKTMASVVWKYWRHHFGKGPVYMGMKQVWTGMKYMGDGKIVGYPESNTQELSTYLNNKRIFQGSLGPEGLFDESTTRQTNKPPVLKIGITGPDFKPTYTFTRLEVAKHMLEAFASNILVNDCQTHTGLVTFSDQVRIISHISDDIRRFKRTVAKVESGGDPAFWDALAFAGSLLEEHAARHPGAKKRIICITDGGDGGESKIEKHTGNEVCYRFEYHQIEVDIMYLGAEEYNKDLYKVMDKLKGYYFKPKSIFDSLDIYDAEPILSRIVYDEEDSF
ncbi:hypothetical protein F5X99DRAFT_432867 [Biscogniauxia marginata]|nr:hypothetical protein F5X99DRAFT_432867 [Biscogniauxia marginata]